MNAIKLYIQEARPTMFLGVPRVWEKIQDRVEAQINDMKGFNKAVFKWAQVCESVTKPIHYIEI